MTHSPQSSPLLPSADSANLNKLLLTLAIAVNFSGLFLTIIGPDGTLYAAIAKTMVMKDNYVEMFGNGTDWLDKPHFPFWITAISFKLFGISNWSYKLPAILFLMVGVVYTWKFAMIIYKDKTIANWSVLILLTAEHIILSNTDVRAEPYLTTTIIAAVYHFQKAYTTKNTWQLIAGSLFTAFAIMTKGIFAIIPIGAAIGGHLLFTGNWKEIFNLRWLLAGVLILLFITPELYALYYQFDLHPEKIVFGKTGVSGYDSFSGTASSGVSSIPVQLKERAILDFSCILHFGHFCHGRSSCMWPFTTGSKMLFRKNQSLNGIPSAVRWPPSWFFHCLNFSCLII